MAEANDVTVGHAEIAFFATTPDATLTTPASFTQIDDNPGMNKG